MKTKLTEIEMAKQELIENAGGGVGAIIAIILISLMTQGCSGMGVKAEVYRVDSRTENTITTDKSLKCLFTDCGGK